MEKFYPSQGSSLLVVQPQSLITKKTTKAVSPFNCLVDTGKNENEYFRNNQNNLANPFGIFGRRPVSCLVVNMGTPEKKTGSIFGKAAENIENFSPELGLCPSAKVKNAFKEEIKGIGEMVEFPSGAQALRNGLRKYIDLSLHQAEINQHISLKQSLEEFPVINLRTYYLLSELAARQEFSLKSLWSSWVKEMETFFEGLVKSFNNGDSQGCEQYCFSLKNLAGTLGASQLAHAAKNLEKKIKGNQWTEAGHWLPVITENILLLKKFLAEMPQENSPGSV